MTEEQAKTKACCGPPAMANAALPAAPHLQAQPLGGTNLGMCIASACMAWRSRHPENGYCGLAGNLS